MVSTKKVARFLLRLCSALVIPASASAHIVGPEFILFAAGFVFVLFVIITFAIGLIKYVITACFFSSKLGVSRKKAFTIIMIDSAVFGTLLLGATPIDVTSLMPIANGLLKVSESLGILIFYLSLKHPILFKNLLNTLFALPVLYPISVVISAQLFKKAAQSSKESTSLKGRWQPALANALITPIGICIAIVVTAVPMIMNSQTAIDTLFEEAVVDADVDMAAALLRHGAHVNAKSRYGGSILQTSFAFGRMPRAGAPISIVRFLLDNGADVNGVENENRVTVLMRACEGYGRLEEFRLLLERQPDLHAVDREGNGALYYALKMGQIDKAALLIAKGVDTDRQNNAGRTVLMEAAERGNKDVVQFLLDNNANIRLKNSCGLTALKLAVLFERKDVVEILLASGGDPGDIDRATPSCGRIVEIPIERYGIVRKQVQPMAVPPHAAGVAPPTKK